MIRPVRSLAILIFCLLVAACTGLRHIEDDFDGIYQSLFPEGAPSRVVKVLLIHGFGEHCIGHAQQTIDVIVRGLGVQEAEIAKLDSATSRWQRLQNECKSRSGETVSGAIIERQTKLCREPGAHCKVIAAKMRKTSANSDKAFTYGYLRIQEFHIQKGDILGQLKFYELTWDPATRLAKYNFLGYDWGPYRHKQRAIVNRRIKKELLNARLSDPVLYLGTYKPYIQVPIVAAICAMVMTDNDGNEPCNLNELPLAPQSVLDLFNRTHLVIISKSLGSYLVFDTIRRLTEIQDIPAGDNAYLAALKEVEKQQTRLILDELGIKGEENFLRARAAAGIAYRLTRTIFMLANQLPLIRLSLIAGPTMIINNRCYDSVDENVPKDRDFRTQIETAGGAVREYLKQAYSKLPYTDEEIRQTLESVKIRFEETAILPKTIAISDPNDVLSYAIPGCSGPNNWFGDEVFNVTTNIKNPHILSGFFVWPVTAHRGHMDNSFVRKLILCGGKAGNPGTANSCP